MFIYSTVFTLKKFPEKVCNIIKYVWLVVIWLLLKIESCGIYVYLHSFWFSSQIFITPSTSLGQSGSWLAQRLLYQPILTSTNGWGSLLYMLCCCLLLSEAISCFWYVITAYISIKCPDTNTVLVDIDNAKCCQQKLPLPRSDDPNRNHGSKRQRRYEYDRTVRASRLRTQSWHKRTHGHYTVDQTYWGNIWR